MFLIPLIRKKEMESRVRFEQSFYNSDAKFNISHYQFRTFNNLWQNIQLNVPFYKEMVKKKEIPTQISSFHDFENFPILNREYVRSNIDMLYDYSKKPDGWVRTGGSTGNPLIYPNWKEEKKNYEPNLWYARDFYNINRADKMFRLWGHSHTLGKGLSKIKKEIAFAIGHPLIGYKRFSAYDLSEGKMKEAGNKILQFKPDYIIGYSKALRVLAEVNKDKSSLFHKLKFKAVIGAAEGFESYKDKEYLSEIFGCPVGLEYASMETKMLAHTHPDGTYKVLWRNNLVESVDNYEVPSNTGKILVTSLYKRAFPLIRYNLGDIIEGTRKDKISVYEFERIQGRDNDFLWLDKFTPIHSEGITHAIKYSNKITAYQIRYTKDNIYTIYVKANTGLTKKDIRENKNRHVQVDYRLKTLEIIQTDKLKQTIVAKTKWLIKE